MVILEGISGLCDSWNTLMCFVENDVDAAMAMNAWWWAPCKCIFTCKAPIRRPSGIACVPQAKEFPTHQHVNHLFVKWSNVLPCFISIHTYAGAWVRGQK